ncbi:hypothetical protein [Roseateles albus]|uniref:Uncharacterized protein n=1 Tax=Roseateles albus TaxID=2987525 RepID=A0ABT5KG31_9BURK|nr:hypothetical protein [Roseateles albus]MDC8771751.1 hypothetical protein [Roseateles albus]
MTLIFTPPKRCTTDTVNAALTAQGINLYISTGAYNHYHGERYVIGAMRVTDEGRTRGRTLHGMDIHAVPSARGAAEYIAANLDELVRAAAPPPAAAKPRPLPAHLPRRALLFPGDAERMLAHYAAGGELPDPELVALRKACPGELAAAQIVRDKIAAPNN